jgi:hypothetical protein
MVPSTEWAPASTFTRMVLPPRSFARGLSVAFVEVEGRVELVLARASNSFSRASYSKGRWAWA